MIFTKIVRVEVPERAEVGKGFNVIMQADGDVPFAQVILRHADGWEWIIRDDHVTYEGEHRYRFWIPPDAYKQKTTYIPTMLRWEKSAEHT